MIAPSQDIRSLPTGEFLFVLAKVMFVVGATMACAAGLLLAYGIAYQKWKELREERIKMLHGRGPWTRD